MINIIDAIMNLIKNPVFKLREEYVNKNRVNNMGDALETYVLDLFAGTYNSSEQDRMLKINELFSYIGNSSNPPDAMIKQGDAIEVKKIESLGSRLQLNSSYPKHKLKSDSPLITKACREAENEFGGWVQKDIIYIVGVVNQGRLKSLSMVYGCDYAADLEVYEGLKQRMTEEIKQIPGIDFSPTKELGRVNRIDPLGITSLRIRPMWIIDNPALVFNYLNITKEDDFNFQVIINKEKWESFDNTQELEKLVRSHKNAEIKDVKIKDSNNPAKLKDAKLVTFRYNEILTN